MPSGLTAPAPGLLEAGETSGWLAGGAAGLSWVSISPHLTFLPIRQAAQPPAPDPGTPYPTGALGSGTPPAPAAASAQLTCLGAPGNPMAMVLPGPICWPLPAAARVGRLGQCGEHRLARQGAAWGLALGAGVTPSPLGCRQGAPSQRDPAFAQPLSREGGWPALTRLLERMKCRRSPCFM